MSIDAMKLAVATLLPDELSILSAYKPEVIMWKRPLIRAVDELEWLHVCHLALQKLGPMFRMRVHARLTNNMISPVTGYDPPACEVAFAPVDELLKAICQVQFPHLFEQPPVSTFHKTTT